MSKQDNDKELEQDNDKELENILKDGNFKIGSVESKAQKLVKDGKFNTHTFAYKWLTRPKRNHHGGNGKKKPPRKRHQCKGGIKGKKK